MSVDAKEMMQFNALLAARASASGIDLSSVSDDTKERVAAMLRSRRERMMEEEKEYLEELRSSEANVAFEREIAVTMTDDEKVARVIVQRQEEKAFERLVKVFDEQFQHLAAGMLTLRQQKEIEASRAKKLRALENQLNRERFYLYWDKHQQHRSELLKTAAGGGGGIVPPSPTSSKSKSVDVTSPEAQMHRMTAVLRRAYVSSAPLFATDPEELWKRGQALPPTAAANATTPYGEVDLPPYHEFGKKIREKYQKHVNKNGLGDSIGGVDPSASPSMFGKQKSSATFPHQQDSPFATAVHESLADYLS